MLQFLDKAALGYAALFGLQEDVVRFYSSSTSKIMMTDNS
jgi:hypothetical protein